MKILVQVLTRKGNYFDVLLPAKREVCPRCKGEGKHEHSSFSNGFTVDELDNDPEFSQAYMRGDYDETCSLCEGRNVVSVPDEDAIECVCSPKMIERYRRAKEAAERSQYEYERDL